jgi:hypothetical protein
MKYASKFLEMTNGRFNRLSPSHSFIGKLGVKQEAAGKMRVFAMLDPWTQ